jgi:hypothetical protein
MPAMAFPALDLRDPAVDHGDHDVPGLAAAAALGLDVRAYAQASSARSPAASPRSAEVAARGILAGPEAKG